MWRLLGQLQLPYIAMHTRGTPKNMQSLTDYDNVTEAVREFFEGIAAEADRHGVEDRKSSSSKVPSARRLRLPAKKESSVRFTMPIT